MSENRFDTTQSDVAAASSAASSEATVKATLQASRQLSDKLEALTNAMTNAQTLQNEAFGNVLNGLVTQLNVNQSSITDKLSAADVSMSNSMVNVVEKLSMADVSMNIRTNDTMDKLGIIIQTLASSSVGSENNWSEIINNLNVKSNETQQTMVEYIGKYVVIPLYKQRLNDISTLYHHFLEKQVICKIERYLLLFRTGDFSNLIIEYTLNEHEEMSNELYRIKREAFKKFLSTSPGATCFSDMTIEAVSSYKSFRKIVSWGYKTLDGLRKSILLYQSYIQVEGRLEVAKIDCEILNNSELLVDYITELNKETKTLFEASVSPTIISPQIKIQYQEYINRYGGTLQFEAEKMALVIRDLIAQGLMPTPPNVEVCSSSDAFSSSCTDGNTSGGMTSDGNTSGGVTSDGNTSSGDSDSSVYPISSDGLSDYEQDCDNTSFTYYVYTSNRYDPSTNPVNDKYYYPLYLSKTDALNAVDISHNQYDASIDVLGHEYTANNIQDVSGVTARTFDWLYPGEKGDTTPTVFWQPNSHSYRAVGTIYFPPTGLEYIRYTENTVGL